MDMDAALRSVWNFIEDNALLAFAALFLILLIVIMREVYKLKMIKAQLRLAELDVDNRKLEMVSRDMVLKRLRDSSITFTDDERGKLDGIRNDASILSRKALFLTGSGEERLRRLELGVEVARLNKMLNKLKSYEKELFGKKLE